MISDDSRTPRNNPDSPLLSRPAAARYLGIAPETLANWASSGRYGLPYIRVGRRALYRRTDLDAFIARRRRVVGGAEPRS